MTHRHIKCHAMLYRLFTQITVVFITISHYIVIIWYHQIILYVQTLQTFSFIWGEGGSLNYYCLNQRQIYWICVTITLYIIHGIFKKRARIYRVQLYCMCTYVFFFCMQKRFIIEKMLRFFTSASFRIKKWICNWYLWEESKVKYS
jgi:hypothetical protein